jgi:hypothetical protein
MTFEMPLIDRREMIPAGKRIQFSQALPGDAWSIFHLVDKAGLEGVVFEAKEQRLSERTFDQLAEGQVLQH